MAVGDIILYEDVATALVVFVAALVAGETSAGLKETAVGQAVFVEPLSVTHGADELQV